MTDVLTATAGATDVRLEIKGNSATHTVIIKLVMHAHAHTQRNRNDLRSETVSATKMSSETFTVSHTPSNSHCRCLQSFMMAC